MPNTPKYPHVKHVRSTSPSGDNEIDILHWPIKIRRLLGSTCVRSRPSIRSSKPKPKSEPTTMTTHISVHNWNDGLGRRHIGQKTFISTCHFQAKQVPVNYTETIVLQLNSTKRRYYESVSYETKMVPSQWSQTMFVDLAPTYPQDNIVMSEVNIPCYENYISLIPQQLQVKTEVETETEMCNNKNVDSVNNNNSKKDQISRPIKAEMYVTYHKNTCEAFLDEMRKMY